MDNPYEEHLDVAQLLVLGAGAPLLVVGLRASGDSISLSDGLYLAIGGVFMALVWTRNFVLVGRRDLPQDFSYPARDVDAGDRIVVWMTLVIAVLVGIALYGPSTGLLLWALVACAAALLIRIVVGLAMDRSPDLEAYALPVVSLLGPVRVFFFVTGGFAIVEGLADPTQERTQGDLIVLLIGVALVLAGALEQGFLQVRQASSGRPDSVLGSRVDELRRVVDSHLDEHVGNEHELSPAAPAERPRWLIALVALALLGLGSFIAYQAVASDSAALGPIVLAGLVLVLAVMGERLSNLTFKAGEVEVTLVAEGAAGDAPTPEALEDPVNDTAPVALISPEGETLRETIENFFSGDRDHVRLLRAKSSHLLVDARRRWRPARQQTIRLKGPADDVAALLDRLT